MRIDYSGIHNGFEFKVLIMDFGHRCGYVKLEEGHPWYDLFYDDIDVRIHGGLTYSEHVSDHSMLEDGYWIGFDCAHCFDIPDVDEMSKEYRESGGYRFAQMMGSFESGREIRNTEYVKNECINLCEDCEMVNNIKVSYDSKPKIDIVKEDFPHNFGTDKRELDI